MQARTDTTDETHCLFGFRVIFSCLLCRSVLAALQRDGGLPAAANSVPHEAAPVVVPSAGHGLTVHAPDTTPPVDSHPSHVSSQNQSPLLDSLDAALQQVLAAREQQLLNLQNEFQLESTRSDTLPASGVTASPGQRQWPESVADQQVSHADDDLLVPQMLHGATHLGPPSSSSSILFNSSVPHSPVRGMRHVTSGLMATPSLVTTAPPSASSVQSRAVTSSTFTSPSSPATMSRPRPALFAPISLTPNGAATAAGSSDESMPVSASLQIARLTEELSLAQEQKQALEERIVALTELFVAQSGIDADSRSEADADDEEEEEKTAGSMESLTGFASPMSVHSARSPAPSPSPSLLDSAHVDTPSREVFERTLARLEASEASLDEAHALLDAMRHDLALKETRLDELRAQARTNEAQRAVELAAREQHAAEERARLEQRAEEERRRMHQEAAEERRRLQQEAEEAQRRLLQQQAQQAEEERRQLERQSEEERHRLEQHHASEMAAARQAHESEVAQLSLSLHAREADKLELEQRVETATERATRLEHEHEQAQQRHRDTAEQLRLAHAEKEAIQSASEAAASAAAAASSAKLTEASADAFEEGRRRGFEDAQAEVRSLAEREKGLVARVTELGAELEQSALEATQRETTARESGFRAGHEAAHAENQPHLAQLASAAAGATQSAWDAGYATGFAEGRTSTEEEIAALKQSLADAEKAAEEAAHDAQLQAAELATASAHIDTLSAALETADRRLEELAAELEQQAEAAAAAAENAHEEAATQSSEQLVQIEEACEALREMRSAWSLAVEQLAAARQAHSDREAEWLAKEQSWNEERTRLRDTVRDQDARIRAAESRAALAAATSTNTNARELTRLQQRVEQLQSALERTEVGNSRQHGTHAERRHAQRMLPIYVPDSPLLCVWLLLAFVAVSCWFQIRLRSKDSECSALVGQVTGLRAELNSPTSDRLILASGLGSDWTVMDVLFAVQMVAVIIFAAVQAPAIHDAVHRTMFG